MAFVSPCGADQLGIAARETDHQGWRHVWTGSPGYGPGRPAYDCVECSSATWRSGGIADQAGRGRERFGSDSPRAWWHARPHRCPAVCGADAVVLYGLASDAVGSAQPPTFAESHLCRKERGKDGAPGSILATLLHTRAPQPRKIEGLCRLGTNS